MTGIPLKFKVEATQKHYKCINEMRRVLQMVTNNFTFVNHEELTENNKKYYRMTFKFYDQKDVDNITKMMYALGGEPIDGIKRKLTKEELDKVVVTVKDPSGNTKIISKEDNNGEHKKP